MVWQNWPPSSSDWENVRAFVSFFLKGFLRCYEDILKSSQQVSLHTVFHNLASILCELQKETMDLKTVVVVIREDTKAIKYDKYWWNDVKMNQLLYFGAIFDYRYKFEYI